MTCQMLHSLSCPHRVFIENEMIQRWPKDGPKEGRSNPKNLEYILTIHILSTARELCIRKIQCLTEIIILPLRGIKLRINLPLHFQVHILKK